MMHALTRRTTMVAGAAALGLASVAGAVIAAGAPARADSSCATSGSIVTCTYGFTGSAQTYTVPAGVTSLDVTAAGAAGGNPAGGPGAGGAGASVEDTAVPVSPGQVLTVIVGGPGANGSPTIGGAGGYGVRH